MPSSLECSGIIPMWNEFGEQLPQPDKQIDYNSGHNFLYRKDNKFYYINHQVTKLHGIEQPQELSEVAYKQRLQAYAGKLHTPDWPESKPKTHNTIFPKNADEPLWVSDILSKSSSKNNWGWQSPAPKTKTQKKVKPKPQPESFSTYIEVDHLPRRKITRPEKKDVDR